MGTERLSPTRPCTVVTIDGADNRLLRNEVVNTPLGPTEGIVVDSGAGNRLVSNKIEKVGGDGIRVNAGASGTLIRGNQSNHSADDGIDVRDPTARLGDNVTYSNTDLGIEAVPGVIDLGGNRASGNGNALEYVNVFCLPG